MRKSFLSYSLRTSYNDIFFLMLERSQHVLLANLAFRVVEPSKILIARHFLPNWNVNAHFPFMLESELVIGEPFSLHSYALSNNEERFMLQCRRGHSLPNSCLAWKRVLREQLVFLLRRQNSSCWCSKREAVAAGESRERTEWMESNLLGHPKMHGGNNW